MGGMEDNRDCFVAIPTLPQDSHLYPASSRSVVVNLSNDPVTSVRDAGTGETLPDAVPFPYDREEEDDPFRAAGGDEEEAERTSSPMSSMGSVVELEVLQ